MATNRTIRGLSGAGFRVPNSSGVLKKVNENTSVTVNVDDIKTQLILAGEKDNFIRTPEPQTFTVTSATPAVFSATGHGYVAGDPVSFSTTGALYTGLTAGTRYYVIATGLTADAFRVSATIGGTAINTSGSQSGTHTVTPQFTSIVGLTTYGIRLRNAAGTLVTVKRGLPGAALTPVKVDLSIGATRRNLRRSYGRYVVSTSGSAVTIRGIDGGPALGTPSMNGFELDTQGVGVITSNNTNVTAADTVTVGAKTYTWKASLTEVKASAVLTSDNTDVADGDTVTINNRTYRFKDTMALAYDVKRDGTTADTTLANLIAAVNQSGTPGTEYFAGTLAPTGVTAGSVVAHAVTFTATTPGTAGNAFPKSETSAHLDWDGVGATFTGGVASVANEVLRGGSADASLTNLSEAINAGSGAGTDYSTATTANADATASAVAAHAITLTAVSADAGDHPITLSGSAVTLTLTQFTSGLTKVYRLHSATVNPSQPRVYQQLRRYYKKYIEV